MEAKFNAKEQTPNYDEVFLQRYDSIYKWGLHITKHNHELAEDLIHDVYMRFIEVHRNLADVVCFDNYFYIALRNSYISYLRRTAQREQKRFDVIEFDLADGALLTTDLQRQFEAREILQAICQYACFRKKTSISASILILRFFHGYFPNEIARIIKNTRNAVEVHLVMARREATAYIADPNSFPFVAQSPASIQSAKDSFSSYHSTIENLLGMIFAARKGDCIEQTKLNKIYQAREMSITRNFLSHVVSCPFCLSAITRLLGLPT